jgi:MFS family permease
MVESASHTAPLAAEHDARMAADHGRWRAIAVLTLAELLGMSAWFAFNAVAPQFRAAWHLSAPQVGWLNAAVQLGFVFGTATAALLNLADVLPVRRYFATAATGAAIANLALLLAHGMVSGWLARFFTGVFLAGVYPPSMKMAATWFQKGRGLAIGIVVGGLSIGKGLPYLIHALPSADARSVLAVTSLAALGAGALVLLGYRDGPFPFPRRPFSWRLAASVAHSRGALLAIGGYLGHMWELYAMWVWVPAYLAASFAARAAHGLPAAGAHADDLVSFGVLIAGGAGCVWGGWAAARSSYERVTIVSMIASGACALATGLAFGGAPAVVAALVWVWGFFVVSDSAQFSALVTEESPPHAVGTALTLQTSVGFLLTIGSIQLLPVLAGAFSWRWAFAALAIGPAIGVALMRTLARERAARDGQGSRGAGAPATAGASPASR